MKILPIISYKPYRISNNGVNTQKQPFVNLPIQNDTVSFYGKKQINQITDLRLIPDITCACCGDVTIPNYEVDNFMKNEIIYSSDEALTLLKRAGYFNKRQMSKSERNAYEFCRKYANLYEGQSLNDIVKKPFIDEIILTYDKETQENIKKTIEMTNCLYHNASYMVKAFKPYEDKMHKTEKEVYKILEAEAERYPHLNFSQILSNPWLQKTHLKKLEQKQNVVFVEIEDIASRMSPESLKKISRTVKLARGIFDLPQTKVQNKRTAVIEAFIELEDSIKEKEEMRKILAKIYELPSSLNDSGSFIIKYAGNTPNEIADLLLRNTAATHEHVKPKKRENDKGKDDNSNYIVLCRKCNIERARMPYSEFIKFHPDMPSNLQKYLDKVIHYINNGILIGFDKYPLQIHKAIDKESDKTIKLSFVNLDLLEAERKRNQAK